MSKTQNCGFASAAIEEVARMHGEKAEDVLASITEALLAAQHSSNSETNEVWRTIPAGTPDEIAAWVINAVAEAIVQAAS